MNYQDEELTEPQKQDRNNQRFILILAVAVVAGTLIFSLNKNTDEEQEQASGTSLEEGWYDEVLSHLPPEEANPQVDEQDPPPSAIKLPALDESDPIMQEKIAALSSKHQLLPWLQSEHIIRRGAAIVNGLSDGIILSKLMNVQPPKGQFRASKSDDQYWLSTQNYQRYEYLINVIDGVNSDSVSKTYKIFRPLIQQAYGELGIPDKNIDHALNDAMDQILSAPILESPPKLKQESVAYTFADPDLENLPPLQKLLIRMGPENTLKIQNKVKDIKSKLLGSKSLSESGVLGR